MLVCNVSLRPPRPAIAAAITETTTAVDATATGNVVFATLVDDPASVGEIVDAYLGEIMIEAASSAATVDATVVVSYDVAIVETATAVDAQSSALAVLTATLDGTPMNATMSNGNLTVTRTSGSGATGVYSTSEHTTGKYYFEFTLQTSFTNTTLIGIAPENTFVYDINTIGLVVSLGANSGVLNNGVSSGKTVGSAAVNDIFAMAVDLTARVGWFRRQNGNWNGDAAANPATGTGGVSFNATVPFAPYIKFASGLNNPDAITVNFGASGFSGTVPSGFTSGWSL